MPVEKLIKNPKDIKIKEDQDIQQILGRPPGWILHWGITLVFFAVTILLIVSYIVKFPDIIPARIVLTTENPPVRVFTRAEGKLSELMVKNEEAVKENTLLAVMENTAKWKEVLQLEKFVDEIYELSVKQISKLKIPRGLNLGSLQNSFALFSRKMDEYVYFIEENNVHQKVKSTRNRIYHLRNLNKSLEKQKVTLSEVVELAQRQYKRSQDLLKEGARSQLDVDKTHTVFLERQRELEAIENQIINNNIEKESLKIKILDFEQGKDDQDVDQSLEIKEHIEQLKSAVKMWKQQYLIYAPIDGRVNLVKVWSRQHFFKAQEELLTIIPVSSAGKIIGKAVLSSAGAGKVKIDMPANIRLDGYPYQEFGAIEGSVKNISGVPENGQYLLEIEVPKDLRTTYEKTIEFRQEMTGVANIITEDRRILERILDRIWSLLKNR